MPPFAPLFFAAAAALQQPAGDAAFQKKANEAIDRGAAWLRQGQKPNGTWNDR
jgi:hypothetical protein